ncbi:T6SS immunity protein Tdi1 domain-containing protein [Kutzneria sp. 744]|uniref:T6SS immunity protein Tdi1 domain-containing protein n=1 Tax=Kutzneria sp. (strain 744) TaxID=345341 RepID=UPI0003EEB526|nr:T6SS immunity protein Tdi1 domain-containing protein [Kutzneria sp. 744]EWM17837.1 hypothetical protein KUTG_08141 [Kutzneria sp. 744]
MFERFLGRYTPDDLGEAVPWVSAPLGTVTDLVDVTNTWGGVSFNSGLYRVHSESSSRAATAAIQPYLQEAWSDAIAFAFDWLGRNFVVSPSRWSKRNPLVCVVDMGEGRVFEIPASLGDFHNVELVDYANEALAADWFSEWRVTQGGLGLKFEQCVGYRTPLFLGGTDGDDNLEIADIDVYWALTSQIYEQVKSLPEGTPIAGLNIDFSRRDDKEV